MSTAQMSAEAHALVAQLVKFSGWFIFSCGRGEALAAAVGDLKLAQHLRTMAVDIFDRHPAEPLLEWRAWDQMAHWLEEQELRITQAPQQPGAPLSMLGMQARMLALELGRARMHAHRLALLLRGEELERLASEGLLL